MPTFSLRTMKRSRKKQIVDTLGQSKESRKYCHQINQGQEIDIMTVPSYWRPKTYGDCRSMPRPCPFVGCRYNLYLESSSCGTLKVLKKDVDKVPETCALDVAERGGVTLDEVGKMLGVSRERIRQLESDALSKLAQKHPDLAEFFENLAEQHAPSPEL